METEKKEVIFKIKKLKTWFPIKKGFMKKVVGNVKAVDDVSIEVYKGETLGIVGESGCGKSTFGKTVMMLEKPTDGEVLYNYNGEYKDVTKFTKNEMFEFRKKVQMVFQDPYSALNPQKKIYTSLEEPLKTHGVSSVEEREKIMNRVLKMVNIQPDYLMRFPHEFSGGQRQRLCIARALEVTPEVLICDEPVSALDVSIQAQVLNLMKEIQKEMNLTYLFIAHDLSIVRFISDRIGVIYKGNIVEVADAEELFNFPLHPYTHSLISAIPIPDPQLEKNKVLYTYDPSIHDYSVDKPEFVDIGHNHFVYGNKKEIEEYKALREKGEPLQPITIRKPGEEVKEENHEVHLSKAEDEFLKTPVHDTGSVWYKVLSFFFPIIGIIAAMVYKKKQYYHNYKACKQGALYGFAVLAVILLIFIIALILVAL